MKTPVTIIAGPRQGQHGFIYGDLATLNKHTTSAPLYDLEYFPHDPMTPHRLPRNEQLANLRPMTGMEKILFKVTP